MLVQDLSVQFVHLHLCFGFLLQHIMLVFLPRWFAVSRSELAGGNVVLCACAFAVLVGRLSTLVCCRAQGRDCRMTQFVWHGMAWHGTVWQLLQHADRCYMLCCWKPCVHILLH